MWRESAVPISGVLCFIGEVLERGIVTGNGNSTGHLDEESAVRSLLPVLLFSVCVFLSPHGTCTFYFSVPIAPSKTVGCYKSDLKVLSPTRHWCPSFLPYEWFSFAPFLVCLLIAHLPLFGLLSSLLDNQTSIRHDFATRLHIWPKHC